MLSRGGGRILLNPLDMGGPIVIRVLNVYSTLTMASGLRPTVMVNVSMATIITFTGIVVSLLHGAVPGHVHVVIRLIIITTLIAVIDRILGTFTCSMGGRLSIFINLVVAGYVLVKHLRTFTLNGNP